jgi:RIP metalloprotease RseP
MNDGISSLHALFSNVWGIVMMIVLLEGSIFVHELGHFLAARWRGLKIDRFSLGFGPKIFGWTGKDGVEYRLSLLPLGGYVALPQFGEIRALEGEPSEVAAHLPALSYTDKMVVAVAGVVFNVLFALALAAVLWVVGLPSSAAQESNVLGYVAKGLPGLEPGDPTMPGPAYAAGLRPGDKILAVDGKPIGDFRDLQMAIALGAGRTKDDKPQVQITYERDGVAKEVDVQPLLLDTNSRSKDAIRQIGVEPEQKLIVDEVMKNSPAQQAGLRKGDEVEFLNGQPLYSSGELIDALDKGGATPVTLGVLRDGQNLELKVTPLQVASTTPLATLSVGEIHNGQPGAKLEVLPIFASGSTGNPALPTTKVKELQVLQVEGNALLVGGLQAGDSVVAVNNEQPSSVLELVDEWQAIPAGQPARVAYEDREEPGTAVVLAPFAANVTPPKQVTMIGVMFTDKQITVYPTPWKQFSDALSQTAAMLGSLINPHSDVGLSMLSGPVGMGRALEHFAQDDIRLALWFTILINVSLAILNLLPIPVLDGGHILLATITELRGQALPAQVVVTTQGVFLVLLMGLMMYVLFNDSRRWLGENDMDREMLQQQSYYLKPDFPPAPATPSAPANP